MRPAACAGARARVAAWLLPRRVFRSPAPSPDEPPAAARADGAAGSDDDDVDGARGAMQCARARGRRARARDGGPRQARLAELEPRAHRRRRRRRGGAGDGAARAAAAAARVGPAPRGGPDGVDGDAPGGDGFDERPNLELAFEDEAYFRRETAPSPRAPRPRAPRRARASPRAERG